MAALDVRSPPSAASCSFWVHPVTAWACVDMCRGQFTKTLETLGKVTEKACSAFSSTNIPARSCQGYHDKNAYLRHRRSWPPTLSMSVIRFSRSVTCAKACESFVEMIAYRASDSSSGVSFMSSQMGCPVAGRDDSSMAGRAGRYGLSSKVLIHVRPIRSCYYLVKRILSRWGASAAAPSPRRRQRMSSSGLTANMSATYPRCSSRSGGRLAKIV